MDAKLCDRCGTVKPHTDYYPVSKTNPKPRTLCKICTCELEREREHAKWNLLVTQKFCPACESTKDARSFKKNEKALDKLDPLCKPCAREWRRILREEGQPRQYYIPDEKLCYTCGQIKSIHDFSLQPDTVDNHKTVCQVCHDYWYRELIEEERQKTWVRPVEGTKHCHDCGQVRSLEEWGSDKKRADGLQPRCKICTNRRRKDARQQLRYEALAYYSKGTFMCACCGEAHCEFLGIDHIHGSGTRHRKDLGNGNKTGQALYRWIKDNDYPDGLRVLCHNCNLSIGFYGYCPHEKERDLVVMNV